MEINSIFNPGVSDEDAILLDDNIFGVFDGAKANNLEYMSPEGKTGGQLAAEIVCDTFSKNEGSLSELALEATQAIQKAMDSAGVDSSDKANRWNSGAAIVRVNEDTFEWLNVSDCLILVIFNDGSFKLLVTDYDHDERELVAWKKLAERKVKDPRIDLHESFLETRRKANITWSSFNGEEAVMDHLNSGEESLEHVKHIVLLTDGLIIPKKDPTHPDDFDTFVKLFLEGGLKHVLQYVRTIEKADPNCWEYPRFKVHDDITAISLSF